MHLLAALVGVFFILGVLVDAFEAIILPRTVMRRVRLSNLFFGLTGVIHQWIGKMRRCSLRQSLLVAWAPLTLLALIATWALLLILGWALVDWGLSVAFNGHPVDLLTDVYFSGVTFLTLGYGDVAPTGALARSLSVIEAGMGFMYLALVIGYVPVLYSAFSRREVQIILLDTRAGSEPTGLELIRRHAEAGAMDQLATVLRDWERFGAEMLESYLSYPLLAYYRSQHDNQSWLRSLTAVMDACALIESCFESAEPWMKPLHFQARATFAMGRHVLVDLSYILDVPPVEGDLTRLGPEDATRICGVLAQFGLASAHGSEAPLAALRRMYEPYAQGLAGELLLELPIWVEDSPHIDNWQTSAWEGVTHF
ncbi:MAG TPA: potassium channel family protein [Fimbriimonas sp.]|nr:potassium channel family protein [Fimbriimonas sp.]